MPVDIDASADVTGLTEAESLHDDIPVASSQEAASTSTALDDPNETEFSADINAPFAETDQYDQTIPTDRLTTWSVFYGLVRKVRIWSVFFGQVRILRTSVKSVFPTQYCVSTKPFINKVRFTKSSLA